MTSNLSPRSKIYLKNYRTVADARVRKNLGETHMMIEVTLSPKVTPQIGQTNSALHCPIVFLF